MNTPGKPKPSSRKLHYLLIAGAILVAIFVVTMFVRW